MNKRERRKWLDALLDGSLTEEQADQLITLLQQDKEAMARFREDWELCNLLGHLSDDINSDENFSRAFWVRVDAEQTVIKFSECFGKRREALEQAGQPASRRLEDSDSEHGYTLSELDQQDAGKVTIEITARRRLDRFRAQEQHRLEELAYREYRAKRRQLIIGCSAAVALVTLVILALVVPPFTKSPEVAQPAGQVIPPVVAKITDAHNALWNRPDFSTAVGTRLTASSMALKQGLLELTFNSGVVAILQAPCQLRLDDPERMFLQQGIVSVEVRNGANGFVIQTPTGTVTDHGTEFGVAVYSNGQTETQVYQGEVALQSNSGGKSVVLTRAQAAVIQASGEIIRKIFRPGRMMRKVPERTGLGIPGQCLNLADVVSGGNGFETGTPDQGIDLLTGMPKSIRRAYFPARIGKNSYIQVPTLPFVDGVFVPDSSAGSVQISSTGLEFKNGPDTNHQFCGDIFGGAWTFSRNGLQSFGLNGQDYGTGMRAIYAHANLGITFDLQAIRDTIPGVSISRFSAQCGVSVTNSKSQSKVDFWILVDGVQRLHHADMSSNTGGKNINIELNATNRFLTLIATDSDLATVNDWGLFAEPLLNLDTQLDVSTSMEEGMR
jgi:hypothetical protein